MEGSWEGYVWLFSERFIWMLNQELAVGIPGGRAYTQAKEGVEKDSACLCMHTQLCQRTHSYSYISDQFLLSLLLVMPLTFFPID